MRKISRIDSVFEQQQLRDKLSLMYSLRDKLAVKNETDQFFQTKTKSTVLNELDSIIDFNLERFYSLRAG